MCLNLNPNWEKEKKKFISKKKKIIGYKVLKRDSGTRALLSLWRLFSWNRGINNSRRESTKLNINETFHLFVGKGFYFFTRKQTAIKELKLRKRIAYRTPGYFSGQVFILARFEINPEEVIAKGLSGKDKCFVATKAKLVKVYRGYEL